MKKLTLNDMVTRTEFKSEIKCVREEIKSEIKSVRVDLGTAISKLDVRVSNIEEALNTTVASKDDIRQVINHIDAWTLRFETHDRKALEHDARINDHEARITRLERPA